MSEDSADQECNSESLSSLTLNENKEENKDNKTKVDILLKPTGNAPIMKKKKWTVEGDKPLGWIIEFMKKYLKLEGNEKLFLYINQTFAPSPDQIIKNLYDCYSADGKLVLHYCKTPAYG